MSASDATGASTPEAGWLTTRRYLAAVAVVALLGVILRWSATKVGMMSDDFMQYGMVVGAYPGEGYAPFDLYAFLRRGPILIDHIEAGTAPWWSVPELHGTVLRPLSSLLLWFDHTLLPGRIELWHAHSMLWFGCSTLALGLVLGRLLPAPMALLAVLFYACEAGTVSPLSWLANRCVLICVTFGLLAFWAQLEWRRPRPETAELLRERGGPIVAGLMTLSIAAGEYGLCVFAYLFAWELLANEGPLGERAKALVWGASPLLVYLLVHKLLGYGTFGAEVYADPFHTPKGYLQWASKRIPKLMTAAFWSVPGATIHVFRFGLPKRLQHLWVEDITAAEEVHAAHVRMALWGVALAALTVALARRAWTSDERRSLRALVVGALLGLFPIAIAPAHSRLLMIAQLGACALLAAIVVGCVRLVRGRVPDQARDPLDTRASLPMRVRGVVLVPLAGLLAYVHTLGDLAWGHAYIAHLDNLQAANIAAFTRGDLLDQRLDDRDVVMLNGPSQSVGLFGGLVLASEGWTVPRTWRPLSLGGEFPMLAARPADDTLVLTAIQGAWMHTAGELFFRREDQPMAKGTVFVYPSLRVEVLEDLDGHPTEVRFQFDRSLDDPSLLFVVTTAEGIQAWPVPAEGKRKPVPIPRLPSVDDADAVHFPEPSNAR